MFQRTSVILVTGVPDTVLSPLPSWISGLQQDLDPEAVYRPFQRLLEAHLPMSQGELASEVGKDRTTVSKWKSGDLKATLEQQHDVVKAVRRRLGEIEGQLDRAESMIGALEELQEAHEEHVRAYDEQTLASVREANRRVRELLEVGAEA